MTLVRLFFSIFFFSALAFCYKISHPYAINQPPIADAKYVGPMIYKRAAHINSKKTNLLIRYQTLMSICLICTFHFRSINNINHFTTLRLVAKISVMQDLSESYKHAIYSDVLIFWTTQRRAVSDSRILFEYIPLH